MRYGGGYDALLVARTRWWDQVAERAKGHASEASSKGSGTARGRVTKEEFLDGLSRLVGRAQVEISVADTNALCATFEPPAQLSYVEDLNGRKERLSYIDYDQFCLAARGPGMRPERQELVRKAYAACREDGRGKVEPRDLAKRYKVSEHPGVIQGTLTEDEAAMAFLSPWEVAIDSRIDLTQFVDRYQFISPLIEPFARFDAVMRVAWSLKD